MTSPLPSSEAISILQDLSTSKGTPQDLTQQQVTHIRTYLLDDLFAFAWLVFGYHDLDPTLHGEICHLIKLWGTSEKYRRLIIQIPRGHFKTSVCTIANSTWQVFRDPNHTVAIFNEKEDNTSKWIRAIKNVIQGNSLIHVVFRDLLPPGVAKGDTRNTPKWWKWTDTELLFERGSLGIPEASITGLGIGSASAGGHWNTLIKDDLISEDAAHQPATMQRAKDWVDNSFNLEKPALGGKDLVACTPWGYDDIYSHMLQRYGYLLYRRAALEDSDGEPDVLEGTPIFPGKFSRKSILALRDEENDYHWSAQLMCQPRPGKDMAFQQSWLRYGEAIGDYFTIDLPSFDPTINPANCPEPPQRTILISAMSKAIILDPAPSEASERRREPRARNAAIVLGRDWWGRTYILDVWAERVDPSDVIDKLLFLADQWACDTIGIEEVNFSTIYRHWLYERARKRNRYLYVKPLKPGKRDKDYRIREKIPGMRSGHYYLNRTCSTLFTREYIEYPYCRTRDILDAWAYDREPGLLPRPSSPEEVAMMSSGTKHWYSQYKGIDPVTGY